MVCSEAFLYTCTHKHRHTHTHTHTHNLPVYSNRYPTRCNFTQFIYIWKLHYMFQVVLPLIIRSAYNCIYSIWYLSHLYCYLPLSWKSWSQFECAVGGIRHPKHTQTSSNFSTIAADSNSVTNTRCSCMRSWWWLEVPPKKAVSRYK